MPEAVAAVVVTYNRAELLLECLAALGAQTRPVDRIVLVDNASTDSTPVVLRQHGYLDHPLIDYTRLPSNTGGAGGFHEGVKRALELGADWIWIMDDDAEPYADALELMCTAFERKGIAAVANLPVGANGELQIEHRGWLHLCGLSARAFRPIEPKRLDAEFDISFCSFVGLAIRRQTVERIGLPKRELFIKGDDLEYCVRLAAIGPIRLVPGSKIRHKDEAGTHVESKTRLGMRSQRVPLERLWSSYFSLRNLLWLRLQHCGVIIGALYSLLQLGRRALGIMLFDSQRLVRLQFYFNAVNDAWRGVFDNDKPRRLTRPPSRNVPNCDPAT
jgi:rhamnopyranosyl-N-acetylglucosaminyl-diphospho-decaprenol beta-1,3/1,4-galactofuranosyltransferase